MSALEFEFELEGRMVRPGQVLHVSPRAWSRAGPKGAVERFHGDTVTLRSDNGAVPTVALKDLSWNPFPETLVREDMRQAGIERPSERDVGVWMAARSWETASAASNKTADGPKELAKGVYWYAEPGKEPVICEKRDGEDFVRLTNGAHQSWSRKGAIFIGPVTPPSI